MSTLELDAVGKSILYFGDVHFPYQHKNFFTFIKNVINLHKPDIVVNMGDEADFHNISMHETDSDIELSASGELLAVRQNCRELEQIIPEQLLLTSNHTSLVTRRAKKFGIPTSCLKPLNEILGVGKKWKWYDEIVADTKQGKIYSCHGKSTAYGKLCKEMGMSCIQGHYHGKFEITWHRSATTFRFNAFAGSFADSDRIAMAYGKNHLPKPIHGCIFVDKHGTPHMIRMR